jgi:hypothetical protein
MKKLGLIVFLCCTVSVSFSQKEYKVDGESFQLKTEVEGSIDLLWNVIDGNYRYFVEKDGEIEELTNTKNNSGSFQEEYLITLKELTGNSEVNSKSVKLILPSLRDFVNQYNASADPNYVITQYKIELKSRLGLFAGVTNNPFIENPDNSTTPLFGAELELYDDNIAKRHATFLQLTHILENDELKYSTTEIALGYRFRFIYSEKFNMHANLKLVTLSFSNSTVTYVDEDTMEEFTEDKSATSFDAPVIFGIGVDLKISDNSFITFYYNELFALSLDNQGNFSTNIALGYKFKL